MIGLIPMWLMWLVAVSLLGASQSDVQEPLTDKQVARVIDRADKLRDPYVCVGRPVAPEFLVCIQGPEQRVALAAVVAKQAHRRLRPADVPADARSRTWSIVVRPSQPALVDGHPVHTALAEGLTLQVRGHPELSLRPLSVVPVPVSWDNAIGVTLAGQGLSATFDP